MVSMGSQFSLWKKGPERHLSGHVQEAACYLNLPFKRKDFGGDKVMGNVTLKMPTDVIGVEKTPKDVEQGWECPSHKII